jgi:hypothetical protein
MPAWVLDQPFAPTPFVLTEQHAAEFGQPVGAVLEYAQDRFAVGDRQRHDTPASQRRSRLTHRFRLPSDRIKYTPSPSVPFLRSNPPVPAMV